MRNSIKKNLKPDKIILITNDKKTVSKFKKMALESNCKFSNYTEDDWATFDDIEQYIQDEELLRKVVALPSGYRSAFSLEEVEAEAIKRVINGVNGNALRAAKCLKIGRATLYRKLDKYGLSLRAVRSKHQSSKTNIHPIKKLHIVKKAS